MRHHSKHRRAFLKSTVSAGAAGLTLAEVLRCRAEAAQQGRSVKDTAIIQIWLGGGPSQFETYDPKPLATEQNRGPWNAISTTLPGEQFCELLPRQARLLDKMAIIRSACHTTSDHHGGVRICSTGKKEMHEPSSGSISSLLRGPNALGVPSYAHLSFRPKANPQFIDAFKSSYVGDSNAPYWIYANPATDDFQVPNLDLVHGLSLKRMEDRSALAKQFDRIRRGADVFGAMESMDYFQRSAFEMVTGPAAREAFDLSREDPKNRDRYGITKLDFVPGESPKTRECNGRHRWGQSVLLARRLVEAGVTFVTVNTDPGSLTWDVHGDKRGGAVTYTMQLAAEQMDQMVSALTHDLYSRGLDKKVLVVVWGEFGRTPMINKCIGRDHWPNVFCVAMIGGGLKTGQIIGASDAKGAVPADRPVSPHDVLATMYRHLGIDPRTNLLNRSGRPIPILSEGEVIQELI